MCNDEQVIYATLVEINQEPTELYKILKFENIVSGGGEAKQVISEGYVMLNGEVETRKRKKVYAGDLLYFNGQYFQVTLKGSIEDYELPETAAGDVTEPFTKLQPERKNKQDKMQKKRKPISF